LEEEVWNCHHISVVKEIKCPSNLTMKWSEQKSSHGAGRVESRQQEWNEIEVRK
jgi:hypothetical protein